MKTNQKRVNGHLDLLNALNGAKNAKLGHPVSESNNRFTSNRAKCLLCGQIIESKHRHHFVPCRCGNLIVDGGLDYLKRIFNKMDSWIDMSETSKTAEGSCENGEREPGDEKKRIKRRKTLVGNKRLTRRRMQKEARIK